MQRFSAEDVEQRDDTETVLAAGGWDDSEAEVEDESVPVEDAIQLYLHEIGQHALLTDYVHRPE